MNIYLRNVYNHQENQTIDVFDLVPDNLFVGNTPIGEITDSNGSDNNVLENANVDSAVGITASAIDPNVQHTVSYSLSDDSGGLFRIDETTGEVMVNGSLDYETATSHDITVLSTSTDGSSSTKEFSIEVTEVDAAAHPVYVL